MNETTTVFLHGAGAGAWVWDRVLDEMTVPAVALDVPGRVEGVTPDRCAAALVGEIDRRGIGSVLLVVHSLAGVLVPGMASRLGPRLKQCVYVAAVVPPSGGAFVDAQGFMHRMMLRLLFKRHPGGLKPSPAMIRRELCNDLDAESTDLVLSRYAAELPGLYLAPAGPAPNLARPAYVKLLKDQCVPPSQQDAMIARLRSPRVIEIEAGHLAMLSAPAELAERISAEAQAFRQAALPAAR